MKTWIFFSFLWYGPIKSQSRRTPVSLFAWWKIFFCESEDCLLSKKGSREVVTSRHMRPCFILFGIIAFHSHARHNRHFIGDIQEIQQVFPIFMWHFMFMWNFKCNSSNVNIDFWYCKKLAWNIDFGNPPSELSNTRKADKCLSYISNRSQKIGGISQESNRGLLGGRRKRYLYPTEPQLW